MYKALVLVTSLPQADEFQRHLVGAAYTDVQFKYPASIIKGEQTPEELLSDVREMLGNEHIDAVVNLFPGLELVQTALLVDFPHIRCTSFEAAFVCGHRYYSHEMALQGFNCPFRLFHLEDHNIDNITLFEETGFPVTLADNFRLGQLQSRCIRTMKQFYRQLPQIKTAVTKTAELMEPLLRSNIPRFKYPIAFQPNCIVEAGLNPKEDPQSTHYIEGCVMDGEVTPWVISDVITCPGHPEVIRAVAVPTGLEEAAQFQLWAVFRGVLDNLQHVNFDNQFLTIKATIHRGGRVSVLGMYACVLRGSTMLYRHVFQNGDNIRAQIKIATGQMLPHPKALGGRFAMRAYLTTFRKGGASEILDYKVIKETPKGPGHLYGVPPEDAMIEPDDVIGFRLGEVNIFGNSCKDSFEQMYQLAEKVMKDADDSNWSKKE